MGPGGFAPPPHGGFDPNAAMEKVKVPAIIMMICTIIGMVFMVVGFLMNVLGTGLGVANGGAGGNDVLVQLTTGAIGIVGNCIGLLAGGFCIFAFTKMMKLQSRGIAYTAVIMSMIPCTGSCCYLNIGVGIWALVVLADDNVKASFT